MNENKEQKFKRLAKQRGDRILKDLQLLGNLSNKNNYEYSEADVSKIFAAIASELRSQRAKFNSGKKSVIDL